MKQNFTTWAGYLLVAITAMVAISFTSCTDPFYGGERDPQKDFDSPFIFEVDQPGPFEMPQSGGEITLNVTCNTYWTLQLAAFGIHKDMFELVSEYDGRTFGDGVIVIKITPNAFPIERHGTIRIKTDSTTIDVEVNQAPLII